MPPSIGLGTPLYDPPDGKAKVDIVFVHGLGGDRIDTWTASPTPEIPRKLTWPKDLLKTDCPTARILSYGYDSHFAHFYPLYGPKVVSQDTTIDTYSSNLFQNLASLRSSTKTPEDRPIIFVAHSLGGLVVANALSRQHGSDETAKKLTDSTIGALFLGTPFEGSSKGKWGSQGLRLLSLFSDTKKTDVKDLEQRSAKLISINESFAKVLKERDRDRTKRWVDVACYFEEYPTFVLGVDVGLIVPKASASALPGIDPLSISANHSQMCKFPGNFSNGYKSIAGKLNEWIKSLDDKDERDDGRGPRIDMGTVNYNGNIRGFYGAQAGNIYTTKERGAIIRGATINNTVDSKRRLPGQMDEDDDD